MNNIMALSSSPAAARRLLLWSHPCNRWAAFGWTFFIAENAILSENRTWLIDQLSDDTYHLFYGTLSTIACGSIGYAYRKISKSELPAELILWTKKTKKGGGGRLPASTATVVGWMFMSVGLVMASQAAPKLQIPIALINNNDSSGSISSSDTTVGPSPKEMSTSSSTTTKFQVRCPFDFADKRSSDDPSSLHGTERISRHPGLWSFGFIGLGQAMMANNIPYTIWWLGPAAVALIGGSHTDSRFRRGMGGTLLPEYQSQTSNIPFWAMISGQQGHNSFKALLDDIKPLNACLAIGMSTLWILKKVR